MYRNFIYPMIVHNDGYTSCSAMINVRPDLRDSLCSFETSHVCPISATLFFVLLKSLMPEESEIIKDPELIRFFSDYVGISNGKELDAHLLKIQARLEEVRISRDHGSCFLISIVFLRTVLLIDAFNVSILRFLDSLIGSFIGAFWMLAKMQLFLS